MDEKERQANIKFVADAIKAKGAFEIAAHDLKRAQFAVSKQHTNWFKVLWRRLWCGHNQWEVLHPLPEHDPDKPDGFPIRPTIELYPEDSAGPIAKLRCVRCGKIKKMLEERFWDIVNSVYAEKQKVDDQIDVALGEHKDLKTKIITIEKYHEILTNLNDPDYKYVMVGLRCYDEDNFSPEQITQVKDKLVGLPISWEFGKIVSVKLEPKGDAEITIKQKDGEEVLITPQIVKANLMPVLSSVQRFVLPAGYRLTW